MSQSDALSSRPVRAVVSARAASIIIDCVMRLPKAFQLRQPIGGVMARPFQPGGKAVERGSAASDKMAKSMVVARQRVGRSGVRKPSSR